VTYTQYGNTEVVPHEYLRHMPKSTAEVRNAVGAACRRKSRVEISRTKLTAYAPLQAAAVKAEKFVVPEALVPLATDTEAEKTRKRKRIKMLKSKRRHNT